jgi:protein-S-isoprenylcysteine O-methyltransferase Ste14
MQAAEKPSVQPVVQALYDLRVYLSEDFLGGPRLLKLAWVINFQKGATAFYVLALMLLFNNFSTAAWVYLALHGTYGACWLMKHFAFPDRGWEKRVTLGGGLLAFLFVLGPYWVAPTLLISGVLGPEHPQPSNLLLAFSISLHTLGVAIMLSADAQKTFSLRCRPGLIQDGMFKYIRHPNYLGEMMIYAAYALLVQHWMPWLILAWVWSAIFLVNILMKEASLARYPEWAAYKARTGMLLPRLARPAKDA